MPTSLSHNILGITYAITGYFVFALGDGIAKWLTQYYSVIEILIWAYSAGIVLLCAIAIYNGSIRLAWHTRKLRLHILRGILVCLQFITFFYAIAHIPLANAFTLILCAPIFTAVLSGPVLNEWPDLRTWAMIACGIVGVAIVMRPGFQTITPGLASALLCGLIGPPVAILARKIGGDSNLPFAFYPFAISLIILPCLQLTTGQFSLPALHHLPWLWCIGLTSIGGFILIAIAFNTTRIALAASMQYTQILWGTVIGYLIFSEIPDVWSYIGSAVIVASGLYIIFHTRKRDLKLDSREPL